MALADKLAHRGPQRGASFAERDLAAEVHDHDFADFPGGSLKHG